jgi:hypothetical protein
MQKTLVACLLLLIVAGCSSSDDGQFIINPQTNADVLNGKAGRHPLILTFPDDAPQKTVVLGNSEDGKWTRFHSDRKEAWITTGFTNEGRGISASYEVMRWTGDLPVSVHRK